MAPVRRGDGEPLQSKSGELLSAEIFEALAGEADAGYDLTKAEWRHAALPSRNGVFATRLSFRASPKLYDAVQARARREGRTVSDLAREAIERYIDSKTHPL